MICEINICIFILLLSSSYSSNGLTKVSHSAYHILHNDHPARHAFRFLKGNAPRYRSSPPPATFLSNGIQGTTSNVVEEDEATVEWLHGENSNPSPQTPTLKRKNDLMTEILTEMKSKYGEES
ncbi:uncharacterized protein LOC118754678, partial [Rhagoletis pomonella]|uniref:uncharacterized protein LOC118754678 n=1 Tax=Rhagoletis pomonella TaxID=28610 RepID=UPI001782DF2C